MIKVNSSTAVRAAMALALAAIVGCTGSTGPQGPAGANGTDGTNGADGGSGATGPTGSTGPAGSQGPAGSATLTAESCAVCHGTGQLVETASMHAQAALNSVTRYSMTIDSVSIPSSGPMTPTITFTVKDTSGNGVTGLNAFGITVAKLVADSSTGVATAVNWQSYINRDFASATDTAPSIGGWMESAYVFDGSGATPVPVAGQPVGQCVPTSTSGQYSCTMADDLKAPVQTAPKTYPAVTVGYTAGDLIRIGIQSNAPLPGATSGLTVNLSNGKTMALTMTLPFNGTADLDASFNPVTTDPRALVTMSACNSCHQRLSHHGNRRLDVNYCAMCHNKYSFDPKTPATARETIDLRRIIHKIHMGENLPSVVAGGTSVVNGQDFSKVAFPQDLGNCTACHNGDTSKNGPAANNWKANPNMSACTGCHDRTSFVAPPPAGYTLHTGGAMANELFCSGCHAPGGLLGPDVVHAMGKASLSQGYVLKVVSVTNTKPGQNPVVTISVMDSTGKGVNLQTDPNWTSTSDGASRLGVDIGWANSLGGGTLPDFQNGGSNAYPGQPISIDVLKNGVATSTAGQYTVTSTVAIPANAVGSGAAALEGHPADITVTPHARVPVASSVLYFPITDATVKVRRQTVDPANCNKCHGMLSVHGSNRTLSSTDPNGVKGEHLNMLCVVCHNTEATDINQRPKSGTTADGLPEASIDFKKLIHGIHGAKYSGAGPVIYGFGGNANDFTDVVFPGTVDSPNLLANCTVCHIPGTYNTSAAVNGTTISTGALSDPTDNGRITRTAAACSACHADATAKNHMQQNGGAWGVTQAQIDAANQ